MPFWLAQAQRRHRTILGRCLERLVTQLQLGALRVWRQRATAMCVRRVACERFAAKTRAACVRRAFLQCVSSWLLGLACGPKVACKDVCSYN